MNKLKLLFISAVFGLMGASATSGIVNENTMIHEESHEVLRKTADSETEVPIILVEKVKSINIFDGGKSLVAGGKSSVKIEISYDQPEANAGIEFSVEPNVVVIDHLEYNNGTATGELRAASATDKCVISAWGTDGIKKSSEPFSVKPYETVSDIISNILSSSTVMIFIISVAVTIVARTSIKIFRFGVNYKSNFATVEQQQNFENSIRNEMRNTKSEIQDNLLKICLREINRETKPVKELQKIADDMRSDRQILNVKLDSIDEKYNEIKHMTESYNRLEAKVNRMQYGENTQDIRRVGK